MGFPTLVCRNTVPSTSSYSRQERFNSLSRRKFRVNRLCSFAGSYSRFSAEISVNIVRWRRSLLAISPLPFCSLNNSVMRLRVFLFQISRLNFGPFRRIASILARDYSVSVFVHHLIRLCGFAFFNFTFDV